MVTRRSVLGVVSVLGASAFLPHVGSASDKQDVDQWGSYQYDKRNSGFAPAIAAPKTTYEQWRLQFTGTAQCTPVLYGENVLVASGDILICRKAESGELVWTKNQGYSSLASVDDSIIGRRQDGTIVSLDAANGETLWSNSQPTSFTGSITVAGDQAIIPVRSRVVAVDTASGETNWSYTVETTSGEMKNPQATPTVANGVAFVDAGSEIHGIDLSDGTRHSRTSLNTRAGGSLAASADAVFVGGPTVRALEPVDGSVRWTATNFEPPAAVAVGNGTVYASNTNVIRALNVTDGTERWRKPIGTQAVSRYPAPPVIDSRFVYVNAPNTLLALDREDGNLSWEFTSEYLGELAAPPALSNDGIFLPSGGGVMQVLRTNDWPDATFTMQPSSAETGEQVVFDATDFTDPDPPVTYWKGRSGSTRREGTSLTFEWDLTGDGTFEDGGRSAARTYETAGTYEVTLRVSSADGSAKEYTKQLTIESVENTTTGPETTTSEPTQATDEPDEETSGSAPGFGIGTTVAAVLGSALALRNRLRE